jgi:hypothetical protein
MKNIGHWVTSLETYRSRQFGPQPGCQAGAETNQPVGGGEPQLDRDHGTPLLWPAMNAEYHDSVR